MKENWIVPCSVKFYDIIEHFRKNETIIIKKTSALRENDVAYVYVGTPYSQVKYKCVVVNDDVQQEILEKNSYAIRNSEDGKKINYVELRLEYTYEDGVFSLQELRKNGLGQTQRQARLDRKLRQYIEEVNARLQVK